MKSHLRPLSKGMIPSGMFVKNHGGGRAGGNEILRVEAGRLVRKPWPGEG